MIWVRRLALVLVVANELRGIASAVWAWADYRAAGTLDPWTLAGIAALTALGFAFKRKVPK